MTQAERDRLVALKKAKKKLITQKQAAEELGITERHVTASAASAEAAWRSRLWCTRCEDCHPTARFLWRPNRRQWPS